MLLTTWNVNSLKVRLPRVLEFLEKHEPDVVLLQETKCTAEAFPEAELDAAGYRSVHHSGGRWAGVAILARNDHEIVGQSNGLPGEPVAEEARWVEASVAGIRFASVYVPNGRALDSPEFPRKLAFFQGVIARAGQPRQEPLVIGGDLNVTRADVDVYDPQAFSGSTHVSRQERALLEAILDEHLVDAYRHVHPTEVGFTWWDYRQGHFHRKLGLRIDYLLVDQQLAPGLTMCGIDRDFRKGTKPSDHAPLLARLAER